MILQRARCSARLLREIEPGRPRYSVLPWTSRSWLVPVRWPFLLWQRGAKTKTVVKASSLLQGTLPPLPAHESEKTASKSYPPVLQQHLNNVRKFNDCIVLTRVGDFYEMYFDQVDEYAPQVNLKKAKRNTVLGDVSMAGFQYTQLDRYLKMFVQDLGKQVAISEQIRLPDSERPGKNGGPMYDRRVTRVVTAGTLIDESFISSYENNYLLAVHFEGALPTTETSSVGNAAFERYRRNTKVGLSWVDLSSGEFNTQVSNLATLPSLVARIGPREIVLDSSLESARQIQLQTHIGDGGYAIHFHSAVAGSSGVESWTPMLERAVSEEEIGDFTGPELAAGSQILDYLRDKLVVTNLLLQPPVRKSDEEYMSIDRRSLRGLEIRSTLRDSTFQGSLLHAVRHTVTKSGARLLSQRLVTPSMSLSVINNRLDLAHQMLDNSAMREDIVASLRQTADTLRLLQRFSIGKGDADDLLSLARTVDVMNAVAELLHNHIIGQQKQSDEAQDATSLEFLWDILRRLSLDGPGRVAKVIQNAIDEDSVTRQHTIEAEQQEEAESATDMAKAEDSVEEPPVDGRRASKSRAATTKTLDENNNEIWIMRRTASTTLERTHADLDKLVQLKAELAADLRQKLKAESLTLRWSAQLGHFCHIKGRDASGTLAAMSSARVVGQTKSTRSFYLADWTQLGVRIDDCKLRVRTEEERVFGKLRGQVIENLMKLRRNAAVLDELDVACSTATVAKERNLVRPILNEGTSHHIIGGRHPTVDVGLKTQGRPFTSNDCTVGDRERIYLITGPNMAGKSTYLRQNALITILAQTGLFVPADYASIGLVDKIFSRVGSADNLFQDQSTFMVEMLETAEILKQATPRSFVIMDEVGRGTTPEDGVAVGYACLHHLHNTNRCRTLFATHFHALADMTQDFDGLACYCTDVAEEGDGSWAYVHKLRKGVNRESHALKVARLAGLPEDAIQVAAEVLATFRRGERQLPERRDQSSAVTANG
ncbi:hypothetical protein LTR62_003645 [Meristemomyces frigidus]|uniref:DNA mismatch repair proteins mutS family domain-containing protein n=1 Tax=Meristemomyces frigidus TaxID=1508187 RepID=A0AAN7TFZ3_9PEZI|nr:hypothetical protein LTR62_003645 [Meristemomyces frigidus]